MVWSNTDSNYSDSDYFYNICTIKPPKEKLSKDEIFNRYGIVSEIDSKIVDCKNCYSCNKMKLSFEFDNDSERCITCTVNHVGEKKCQYCLKFIDMRLLINGYPVGELEYFNSFGCIDCYMKYLQIDEISSQYHDSKEKRIEDHASSIKYKMYEQRKREIKHKQKKNIRDQKKKQKKQKCQLLENAFMNRDLYVC